MIHVILKPETILERIKFAFMGIAPSIECGKINIGPGILECVFPDRNSCQAVQLWSEDNEISNMAGFVWEALSGMG